MRKNFRAAKEHRLGHMQGHEKVRVLTKFEMFLRHIEQLRYPRRERLIVDNITTSVLILADEETKDIDKMGI